MLFVTLIRMWVVAAIAPKFRLCPPSCGPRFESQALHLRFIQFVIDLWCENKWKRGRDWPIFYQNVSGWNGWRSINRSSIRSIRLWSTHPHKDNWPNFSGDVTFGQSELKCFQWRLTETPFCQSKIWSIRVLRS